ncbi:hypothetical protein C8T65DRAFT_629252 [Cerioporus squamosus]|nr:hypothetical protein C8T65DRAFT_629252 [Cerioporus squamosus]
MICIKRPNFPLRKERTSVSRRNPPPLLTSSRATPDIMSRRRSALPAPAPRSTLLLNSPTPPSRQQHTPRRASTSFQFGDVDDDDSPNFVKREKTTGGTIRRCCGLPGKGHLVSGCVNVYPPLAPKGFEEVWDKCVLPTIDRKERLTKSKKRIRTLLDDHPSDVYVMLVNSDELLWDIGVAYSLRYAAECLHPGLSWPEFNTGLLVVGRTDDIVRNYVTRLVQHGASPDTWEDIVVDHLEMDVQMFWEEMVAWKPGRRA